MLSKSISTIKEPKFGNESKNSWLVKIEQILLWLSVFLLPWQLRHTFLFATINGGYFEYGSWHLYATDVAIGALLVIWWLNGRNKFTVGPSWLNYPLLAWLVWLTMSIGWAADKSVAGIVAAHWWLGYGWYLYLINRVTNLSQILYPLAWGIGFQAAWGIVQYSFNHSLGLNWLGESVLDPEQSGIPVVVNDGVRQLRAHGMLPHANLLGGLLAMVIPALAYWVSKLSTNQYRWWLMVIIIMVVGAGLSFARMAWLVLIVGLIIALIIGWKENNHRLVVVIGVGLLALAITLASQYSLVINRFSASNSLEQRSVEERIEGATYWKRIAGQYSVRGVGVGSYPSALARIDGNQSAWWYQPIHNIYLLVTGEVGVLGAAILAWLMVVLIWVQFRLLRGAAWLWVWPANAWLVLGLVDHWPVSLQQGRLGLFLALVLLILAVKVSLTKSDINLQ